MDKNLYFIAIIEKALKTDEPLQSLQQAICSIERSGRDKSYKQGFENFKLFISECRRRHEMICEQQAFDLRDYRQLLSAANRGFKPELIILKDGRILETIAVDQNKPYRIESITAATYTVKLSTGLTLWQQKLTNRQLKKEFGRDGDIKMAADSTAARDLPQKTFELLDGKVTIKIFAGLFSGSIQIEVN